MSIPNENAAWSPYLKSTASDADTEYGDEYSTATRKYNQSMTSLSRFLSCGRNPGGPGRRGKGNC